MFDLVGANRCQFLPRHRPNIHTGIRVSSCTNNELFAFRDAHASLVALEEITREFLDLVEVHLVFPTFELEVDDGLLEV